MPLWIESHINLGQHPKTRRLARALGVSVPAALGHLHLLWHWAIQFAQDGDLGAWDVEEVAVAAMWEGCAIEFFNALRSARFVDANNHLHDWQDYAGRLLERRQKDADRLRRWRQQRNETRSDTPKNEDETRFVPVSSHVTVPYPTVPNPTVPGEDAREALSPATTTELMTLSVLKAVKGYPFEYETDLDHIRTLAVDFPTVDIAGTLKDWAAAKTTDPIKAKGRPRAEHRNWCRKRAEWSGNGPSKNGVHASAGRASGRGATLPPDERARLRAARTGQVGLC